LDCELQFAPAFRTHTVSLLAFWEEKSKGKDMSRAGGVLNLIAVALWAFSGLSGFATAEVSGTHSPHGNLTVPCQNCHTPSAWTPIRAVPEFDHNQTKYPLRGMHQSVACTQCHVKPVFTSVGQRCQDCHADIHKRQLGANCEQCHTVRGWQVSVQQIQQHNNRFPLTGAHAAVDCDSCHKGAANSKFQTMSTVCSSCHFADFKSAANPNHVSANFPTACETCHTTDNWLNAKFDHASVGFPLTGGHAVPPRQCVDCHVNNNYNLTSITCISCHLKDFQGTTNPNHVAANFPSNCAQCHTITAWTQAAFDHSMVNFVLTGSHAVPPRQCTDCHANNNYKLTSTTCVSCHLKDFQSATNPNHVSGGFAQTCDTCHNTSAWQPATFDHSKSGFPLTGAHAVPPRQCADCHVNNNYSITSTACISCHQNDYNTATTPVPHAGFPTTCQQCHDTVQWTDGKFDHSATGFPLTGLHTVPPRQCTDCHVNNNYTLKSTACVTCHLKDYQGTTNPNHVSSNFPQTCDQCHSTSTWLNATFNHNSTGFPLTGSHIVPPRQCTDCHVNNNYNITSTSCVSCHQNDYNTATTPVNHIAARFPSTCETCHDTVRWTDGTFNHATTGFQLTGSHTVPPRQCTDCHVSNNYALNSTLCYSCHQKDYAGTTNPAHASAGFPTTCELCHDTVVWTDSTFNHNNTAFPLTGSHLVPPRVCSDCHVNNNYTTLPTTCIGCHQTDYKNTTNPGHAAQPQFFPTTCQNCHNTTAWTGATFNHAQYTQFPTSHGNANNVCSTCHTNSNDYSIFQCTNCHTAAQTNPNHQGVKGYVYNSINCYQCHPSGQGGG
jgi:NMD protein affecting ribosome stability and mRNA decay